MEASAGRSKKRLSVGEVEAVFDALEAAIHLCVHALAAKIVATQRIDFLAHPNELMRMVGKGCPDRGLPSLKAHQP